MILRLRQMFELKGCTHKSRRWSVSERVVTDQDDMTQLKNVFRGWYTIAPAVTRQEALDLVRRATQYEIELDELEEQHEL